MIEAQLESALISLLEKANFLQLGAVNVDNSPHIDTVWFDYTHKKLRVATTLKTKKAKNLQKNNKVFGVITQRDNPYEQAQLTLKLKEMMSDDDVSVCDDMAIKYTGKPFV